MTSSGNEQAITHIERSTRIGESVSDFYEVLLSETNDHYNVTFAQRHKIRRVDYTTDADRVLTTRATEQYLQVAAGEWIRTAIVRPVVATIEVLLTRSRYH